MSGKYTVVAAVTNSYTIWDWFCAPLQPLHCSAFNLAGKFHQGWEFALGSFTLLLFCSFAILLFHSSVRSSTLCSFVLRSLLFCSSLFHSLKKSYFSQFFHCFSPFYAQEQIAPPPFHIWATMSELLFCSFANKKMSDSLEKPKSQFPTLNFPNCEEC